MEAKYIFTIVIFSVALAATLGVSVAAYIKAHEDPTTSPDPPTPSPAPVQPAAGLTKVYVTGGWDGKPLETAESYDPSTNEWTPLASMTTAREYHALGNMTESDGKHYLYAVGGYNGGNISATVEKYDILNGRWNTVSSPMPTKRYGLAVGVLTLDQKQQLYAVGGVDGSSETFKTVEKYDPSSSTKSKWTLMGEMTTARWNFAVGVLTEAFGKQYLYAVGGLDSINVLDTVEKYDPVNNTWNSNVMKMSTERSSFGVGVLTDSTDGKQYMYAVGGYYFEIDNTTTPPNQTLIYLQSVERYDPSTNTWTQVASMNTARSSHTVSVVTEADGKQYMYAAGGISTGGRLKTVEKYDPLQDKWTPVASMSTGRSSHARVGDV